MRETAAARLSRLLSLIPWLEQHDGVTITEAALHFGVSPAELEQDLWLTICCGLPGHGPDQLIDIQFWDDDGVIHVIDAQALDRPLRVSAAEAMSLLVGLRLLAQVPGEHDRAALASATAKLEAASGVDQDHTAVVVDKPEPAAEAIAQAIADGRSMRIVYAGASRDAISERVVDPVALVEYSGRTYLAAWCRSAEAQRTFRLDRILSAEALPEPAVEHPVSTVVPPQEGVRVRVRVEPRSGWLLEAFDAPEVRGPPAGVREAQIVVADLDWLARLVLAQAGGVEVLDPPEARERVRRAAEDALAALGGPLEG